MSFKTAFASCWDICKFNCTNSDKAFYVFDFERNWRRSAPDFTLDLYETYSSSGDQLPLPFPYNEKPLANPDGKRGLTELDDKLASSFLGWIFTVPEVLVWLGLAAGKGLLSALLLLWLVANILKAPVFLFSPETRKLYGDQLKGILEALVYTTAFSLLALLRVPYHLIKAVIRIPVGIGIAVKAIMAPPPVLVQAPVRAAVNIEERQLRLDGLIDELDRRLTALEQAQQPNSDNDFAAAQTASFNSAPSHLVKIPEKENPLEKLLDELSISDRPTRYTCVISGCLMNPPFLIGDGNFYDEDFIKTHLEKSSQSPLTKEQIPPTHSKGIILKTVQDEMNAFVNALEKSVNKQEVIFKIAKEISQEAEVIRERINSYIKQLRSSTPENMEALANTMANDPKLKVSSNVMATAWAHIKTLGDIQTTPNSFLELAKVVTKKFLQSTWMQIKAFVGDDIVQTTPEIFLKLAPEVAMKKFLESVKEIDPSLDNFVIAALREAILEEQQVNKRFYDTCPLDSSAKGEPCAPSAFEIDPTQTGSNPLWNKPSVPVDESPQASQSTLLPQTPTR